MSSARSCILAVLVAAIACAALVPSASAQAAPGCVLLSSGGGVNEWMCFVWSNCAGMYYEVENGENSRGFSKGVCVTLTPVGVAFCDARWDSQGHPDDNSNNCSSIALA